MKLFISAGHNPTKPGACHEGFCEYDEAARWADLLVELLEPTIWTFRVPTGTITSKTDFINIRAAEGDVALEVHFNSSALAYHQKIEGAETLYYPGSSKGKHVALAVQKAMVNSEETMEDRGVKEGWYQQDKSKGVVYLLRKTKCTAIIIEPEFIQQKEKIQRVRYVVCKAIAKKLIELNAPAT